MLKGELTLEQARELVKQGRIVYVVASKFEIVKIFDYHREGDAFAKSQGLTSYNITHPKCPRFVKFSLGRLSQLDMFLDYPLDAIDKASYLI